MDALDELIATIVGGLQESHPLLNLPTPHGLQADIIAHPARRKVVCAGRRAGKTVMAALLATQAFLKGQRVLLSSTSQDQADVFWDYIRAWLAPLEEINPKEKTGIEPPRRCKGVDLSRPRQERLVIQPHRRVMRWRGGEVRVKTGRHPNALRGLQADLLVLDECAYLDPDAWYKVGAPLLADSGGAAVFISTPVRRNWFFHLYQKAVSGADDHWAAWHFTTLDNPYLDAQAVAALAADMSEADYQQEILAHFLEGQGAIFRRVDEVCRAPYRTPYSGHFVFGVDVAARGDFCVVMVLDAETHTVVDMDRFTGVSWAVLRGRIAALVAQWQPERVLIESNSIGSPVIEALRDEGLPVRGFATTAQSKPPLIESLALAFERDEIIVLDDPALRGELMAFERVVSASGRNQYRAPQGLHDDCVMALALAWQAAGQSGFRFVFDGEE